MTDREQIRCDSCIYSNLVTGARPSPPIFTSTKTNYEKGTLVSFSERQCRLNPPPYPLVNNDEWCGQYFRMT
jgi:hypothetical protein